jgi:hypothetical protein
MRHQLGVWNKDSAEFSDILPATYGFIHSLIYKHGIYSATNVKSGILELLIMLLVVEETI